MTHLLRGGLEPLTQRTATLSPLVNLTDLGYTIPLHWSNIEWQCFTENGNVVKVVSLDQIQPIYERQIFKNTTQAENRLHASIIKATKDNSNENKQ